MKIPADYQNLPKKCPGFSVYDPSREYVIIINSNLSKKEQNRIYSEEVTKIEKGLYVEEVLRSFS